MIVFVKTLLWRVTSMCARACASHCSCVFIKVYVMLKDGKRKSFHASVFACLCAPN